MRLSVFVCVLLAALFMIGGWSLAHGAGLAVTALRLVIAAVVLQAGYFLLVILSAYFPGRAKRPEPEARHSPPVGKAKNSPH